MIRNVGLLIRMPGDRLTDPTLKTWGLAGQPHHTARKNGRNGPILGLSVETLFVTLAIGGGEAAQ